MNHFLTNSSIFYCIIISINFSMYFGFFAKKYFAENITNYVFFEAKEFIPIQNRSNYLIFIITAFLVIIFAKEMHQVPNQNLKDFLYSFIVTILFLGTYMSKKIDFNLKSEVLRKMKINHQLDKIDSRKLIKLPKSNEGISKLMKLHSNFLKYSLIEEEDELSNFETFKYSIFQRPIKLNNIVLAEMVLLFEFFKKTMDIDLTEKDFCYFFSIKYNSYRNMKDLIKNHHREKMNNILKL